MGLYKVIWGYMWLYIGYTWLYVVIWGYMWLYRVICVFILIGHTP